LCIEINALYVDVRYIERVLGLRMSKKLLCGIADNLKYSTDRLFEILERCEAKDLKKVK